MMTSPQSRRLIYLYGPPGSGKSTTGRKLAEALEISFHDLDTEIEKSSQQTVPEIFAKEGESVFRQREHAALERVSASAIGVVALGGGALLDPSNRTLAERSGQILLLDASLRMLMKRMKGGRGRPLLQGDAETRLKLLLAQRAEHYQSFSLHIDTTELPLEAVVQEAQIRLGRFRVRGMGAAYNVDVLAGGLDAVGAFLRENNLYGPLVLVTDANVAEFHGGRVMASIQAAGYTASLCVIPAGEAHKTVQTVGLLWKHFLAAGVERSSTILALGGGVVGDLAGFAAAAYLRGVAWVALPTTLLAMVDASIGGKTGADLPEGKNLVGAFHPPRLVLADPLALGTLPVEELRSGLAEVVKHGVINDPHLFEQCAHPDFLYNPLALAELVRRAMAVKIRVVQADPYEKGIRASLNLGHTLGHAIESVSEFRLRHGEAVAIGMVVAARLAEAKGIAGSGLADTVAGVLAGLGLPTRIPAGLPVDKILEVMRVDKKKHQGSVRFALPVCIGEVVTGVAIDEALLLQEIL